MLNPCEILSTCWTTWKPRMVLNSPWSYHWLTRGQWDVGCTQNHGIVVRFNHHGSMCVTNMKTFEMKSHWNVGTKVNCQNDESSWFLTSIFVKSTNHDWSNRWIVKSLLILAVVRLINHWSVRRKTCQNEESSKLLNFNDHYNDDFSNLYLWHLLIALKYVNLSKYTKILIISQEKLIRVNEFQWMFIKYSVNVIKWQ